MSSTKHTPGPWSIVPFRRGYLVYRTGVNGYSQSLHADGSVTFSDCFDSCFFASHALASSAIAKTTGTAS